MKTESKTPLDLIQELEKLLSDREADRIQQELEASLTKLPAPSPVPLFSAPPPSSGRTDPRELLERAVVVHAVDICSSWSRRHKKNFNNQEQALLDAVKALIKHG